MNYKNLYDLSKKVCIVTGGTGYLGSANVEALKDFGATVVVADIKPKETPADLFVECDVSSADSIKACFKKVYDTFGHIDVLVNCATYGAGYGKECQIEFMSDEVWEKGIDGTLSNIFRCSREIIPYMKEKGGSIINYGSMYGIVSPDLRIYGEDNPQKNPPNYGAGKAGVLMFTRYAAGALAQYNIRVNSVTPGPFPAPQNQIDIDFNSKLASKTMLGRVGQNYEISGPVVLLASNASSFMTGSNIVVDGGWTAW